MKIYVDFDDILSETALYFSHLVKKMFGKDVPYENIQMDFDFAVEDSPNALKHLERMEDCIVAVLSRPWNDEVQMDGEKFFRCSDWKKIDSLFQKCKNRCR